MSRETLEDVGRVILGRGRLSRNLTVVWHAGEPCVLPAAWYREAFEILERHRPSKVRLTHSFQTNATLIDEDWLSLFTRPDVRVGVSLDGPEHLHDRYRQTRSGKGSFHTVMEGIGRLRNARVAFHVIAVLTAEALADPPSLIDFFLSGDFPRLCFNIEEVDGVNRASSLQDESIEARYSAFLDQLLLALDSVPNPPWVREVQYCEQAVLASGRRGTVSNHQVAPLAIISVDHSGQVSTFSPELLGVKSKTYNDFLFADLKEIGRPEKLLERSGFRRAAASIEAGRQRCERECAYFRWCGGGAPANKLGEAGRLDCSETLYCRLTVKTLLDCFLDSKLGKAGAERRAAS